jgi:ribosomal-protein-alanine N-acetyltransferase
MNKIWAAVMCKNPASAKVLMKNDFTLEGTFHQDIYKRGLYEDVDYFGLLKEGRRFK